MLTGTETWTQYSSPTFQGSPFLLNPLGLLVLNQWIIMTYVSDYLNLKICQSCQSNRMYFGNNESYKRKDISWELDLKTQCMATSRMKPQCGLFGWAAYLPKCTLRSPHWKYTQILIPMKNKVELTHTNIYPNKTWEFALVLSVEISITQCTQLAHVCSSRQSHQANGCT